MQRLQWATEAAKLSALKMMLNWNAIVDRFSMKFDTAFSTSSKKAHFDGVPAEFAVIDGARSKWCHLLLVNAIIGILDCDSFNLSTRRKFNQQKVLCECILEIRSTTLVETDEEEVYVAVDEGVWSTIPYLRDFLDSNAPYKSKDKYSFITNMLLAHKVLADLDFNLVEAVNAAVRKILQNECTIVQPARSSIPRRRSDTVHTATSASHPHGEEYTPKRPRFDTYNPHPSLDVKEEEEELQFSFNPRTVFYDAQEAMGERTDCNPWDLLEDPPLSQPPLCLETPFESNSGSTSPESIRPGSCQSVPVYCGSSPLPSDPPPWSVHPSPSSPFLPRPLDSPIALDFLQPFPVHHSSFNTRRCFSTGSPGSGSPAMGVQGDALFKLL
ncbi:hypothetical protein B484DRAFT_429692 [Ochromonadaceae sp. CCMP2298]|nr:hypothetical protein B484DRAFT_429692 [Ochromonadaceae sp. CCMP2298]